MTKNQIIEIASQQSLIAKDCLFQIEFWTIFGSGKFTASKFIQWLNHRANRYESIDYNVEASEYRKLVTILSK
jgi:hypothetical protein